MTIQDLIDYLNKEYSDKKDLLIGYVIYNEDDLQGIAKNYNIVLTIDQINAIFDTCECLTYEDISLYIETEILESEVSNDTD